MLFINRWGPVLLWMVVIYSFSANSNPFQVVPPIVTVSDEVIGRAAHVLEFAVLAVLASRAILLGRAMNLKSVAWIFLFSVSYGVFDELHQSLIPGRAFQLLDLGLDVFGVLVGISLFAFSKPRV